MSTPTQLAGVFASGMMAILSLISTAVCGIVGYFWWPALVWAAICAFCSLTFSVRFFHGFKQ